MKNEIKFLGENLYKFRKEKGISQEELANKIGVSRQAVYKWETGERIPDITNLNSLCIEFDKSLEDFIEGAEHLVKNNLLESISQNGNKVESNEKENEQNKEMPKGNNSKKIKNIIKYIIIIIFLIYILSVIMKTVFFTIMFTKLDKYKGADNYTYQKRVYYSTFTNELEYYIKYKDGIQYVFNSSNNGGAMSETWYYYKSPEEKATYGIDVNYKNYLDEENEYTYYYKEGFAYKNSSPYELTSEIVIDNYNISNILNPFYILNIDFKNNDLIIENYEKDPEYDNQVYIKNMKYIDLELGLLTKKEEYELDKLTSYHVYYNYEFDKVGNEIELTEENRKRIIEEHKKQVENQENFYSEYQAQELMAN